MIAFGATILMLIGLFNIFGTYTAGMLGQRFPKRYLLSAIYGLRSVAIVTFLLTPLTPMAAKSASVGAPRVPAVLSCA